MTNLFNNPIVALYSTTKALIPFVAHPTLFQQASFFSISSFHLNNYIILAIIAFTSFLFLVLSELLLYYLRRKFLIKVFK